MNTKKNMFCNLSNLRNESDVEQFLIIRLLKTLGYKDKNIHTKETKTIEIKSIGKGKNRKEYRPDYILYIGKEPILIIDSKDTKVNPDEGLRDALMYAREINGEYSDKNPIRYCIGTNAVITKLCKWDENKPLLTLNFDDFQIENLNYNKFRTLVSYDKLKSKIIDEIKIEKKFQLVKPTVDEIKNIFQKCHDIIWKKETLLPADAFYEFSKLIFLKLNEDYRIHKLLDEGKKLTEDDYHFSKRWIEKNQDTRANPINTILFNKLMEELQDLVEKKEKKLIFEENEEINLKPSTIYLVVELLQDYDLYSIDEDLNGRMFEVFLSAIIRGKKLGAYFTPRNIVETIVKMANLQVKKVKGEIHIDTVLDGCCGSGGFLIDAMANMLNKLNKNKSLQSDYDEIANKIIIEHLYGIEKNPSITRIARINMYVHGDGGSNVFCVDALDKKLMIEKGERKASKVELEELKKLLVDDGLKFDVILTNPPFAMSYSKKEKHEARILEQYGDVDIIKNISYKKGTTEIKSSVNSNVLFLARYCELLRPGGKLIIILDNSVLNSHSNEEYRRWLINNFIIKAIISLPKYSFIQAGAGGVTSILYLEKRKSDKQIQPPIFSRTVKYTGISKSGKEIPENDLPDVVKEYEKFEQTGELYLQGIKKIGNYTDDCLFLIEPTNLIDRLDVAFHSPSYSKLINNLKKIEKKGNIELKRLKDFKKLEKVDMENKINDIFLYADIGVLDKERGEIILDECEEDSLENLPERARLIVNTNDVIFPLSYDSFGEVAIIPKEFDGQLVSNGFYGIKCDTYEEACFLWSMIRSLYMQKQFIHVASGYTQREISKTDLKKYILIPTVKEIKAIGKEISKKLHDAKEARKKELEFFNKIDILSQKIIAK